MGRSLPGAATDEPDFISTASYAAEAFFDFWPTAKTEVDGIACTEMFDAVGHLHQCSKAGPVKSSPLNDERLRRRDLDALPFGDVLHTSSKRLRFAGIEG